MPAPTHCFIIIALIFAVISWITGIISLAVPEWYVIDSTQGKTRVGAFQFCAPNAEGKETCDLATSKGFTFPQCDRGSGQLNTRFGAVQGLVIAGVVASVVASAILGWATFKGCRPTRADREAERIKRQSEPGYVPTPRNDPRPANQRHNSSDDSLNDDDIEVEDADSRRRIPFLDLAAFICSLIALGVLVAACFFFLNTLQGWLFCGEKPCDYLAAQGVAGCSDQIGWVYALSIISWVMALAACVVLVMRWCFRGPSAPEGSGDESISTDGSEDPDSPTTLNNFRPRYGNPSAREMERRERNRDAYRQQDQAYIGDSGRASRTSSNNNPYNYPTYTDFGHQNRNYNNAIPPTQQSSGLYGQQHSENSYGYGGGGAVGPTYSGNFVSPTAAGGGGGGSHAPTAYNSTTDYYQREGYNGGNNYNNNNNNVGRTMSGGGGGAAAALSNNNNNNRTQTANNNNTNTNNTRRQREPGEPDAVLPEGHWEWDNNSQLFWSEEQQYFFDHNSGHFYEPDSGQWYNPSTGEWYKL